MKKEIATGIGEFIAALWMMGAVLLFYVFMATAMHGTPVPGWYGGVLCAVVAIPPALGIPALVLRVLGSRHRGERYGVIGAEDICRIMGGAK